MKILLIVYDNDSYVHWLPQGLAYIAAVLKKAGHQVEIYNQDKFHYSEKHLQQYLNKNYFDVVGVSIIAGYYQYRKLLKISEAINSCYNRPVYLLGGHGPSPEPEFFLKKTQADVIIRGEGEVTIVELLEALANERDLSTVDGISFLKDNKLISTKERELIKDIDTIPFPAWDLFPIDYYSLLRMPHIENSERCMPVLSARGCPFKCNFCYRMDKGIRLRSPENIVVEIKILKEKYNISYIVFSDELLMSSVNRTKELCKVFIKENLNIKWSCNGRLNFAKKDVLKIMKKAGCVFINYGIECMDNDILRIMKKVLNVKQIKEGIENTLKSGISPGFNIIFGNINENKKTLKKGVEFLLKYDDHAQLRTIRPVTPYPGSPLYYYAIEKGLLKDVEDFYEKKHVNSDLLTVNFTELTDEQFYEELFKANEILIKNYYDSFMKKTIKNAHKLYFDKNTNFRGFRQS